MTQEECKICCKKLYKNSKLKCDCCSLRFHLGCVPKNDINIFNSPLLWFCPFCNVFPFSPLSNIELQDVYLNPRSLSNKMKCFGCNGKIKKNIRYKNCSQCENSFHIKCSTKKTSIWNCSNCLFSQLPFHTSTNEDLYALLSGYNSTSSDFLKNIPSFNLKTLIDSLPGENFSKDDFIFNTITSKYYSPIEFKQEKFRKRQLSMAHLNIASLQLHIEELRHLLLLLDHPFDIIAITETRLHQQESLIDI